MLSGTSADAIDVALADIDDDDAGHATLRPLRHAELPWPDGLGGHILDALPPARMDLVQVCALDARLGQAFARAARWAIDQWGPMDLISSHGQTLAHWVDATSTTALGTLQLGAPAWIARTTATPVISDFRSSDIAHGGHGAPLASTLDRLWLGERPTAAINIGGIANLTLVAGGVVTGDTGPGNCLIDDAVRQHFAMPYDREGAIAAAGEVHREALQVLLADPFYATAMPRSTGREYFDAAYVTRTLDAAGVQVPQGADLIATLTHLTGHTIARAVSAASAGRPQPERVVVSGGGAANPTLMRLLNKLLPGVCTSTELGLPAEAKEGYLFALLGYLSARGLPGTVPAHDAPASVRAPAASTRAAATASAQEGRAAWPQHPARQATGADRPVVLGSLTPPAPAPCAPARSAIHTLSIA